jgi:hypothetical protein
MALREKSPLPPEEAARTANRQVPTSRRAVLVVAASLRFMVIPDARQASLMACIAKLNFLLLVEFELVPELQGEEYEESGHTIAWRQTLLLTAHATVIAGYDRSVVSHSHPSSRQARYADVSPFRVP